MKISEVNKTNRQALRESLEQSNDTGFAVNDLMKIYDSYKTGQWDCVDIDDEIARIDAMIAEEDANLPHVE